MKLSDLSLYIKRKMGFGMPLSYKLRVLSPAVLIVLVSLVLNFSLIFIISMSQGIENLLIYLGSGNIMVMGKMEEGEAFSTYETRYSGSLAFSESSSSPMYLKGVDFSSYFTKERRDVLHLEYQPDPEPCCSNKSLPSCPGVWHSPPRLPPRRWP